jgi:hypothetical protein
MQGTAESQCDVGDNNLVGVNEVLTRDVPAAARL